MELRSKSFMLPASTCNFGSYCFSIHISRNTWLQITALIPYTQREIPQLSKPRRRRRRRRRRRAVPCRHDAMATLSELWRLEDEPGRIQVHHQPKKNGYRTSQLRWNPIKMEGLEDVFSPFLIGDFQVPR